MYNVLQPNSPHPDSGVGAAAGHQVLGLVLLQGDAVHQGFLTAESSYHSGKIVINMVVNL